MRVGPNHDLINSVQASLEQPVVRLIVPGAVHQGMMTLIAVLRDQENRLARLEARASQDAGVL